MQKIRYFSTFSGIGGFELGMQQTQNKLCTANKKQRMQGVGSTQGQFGECSNVCSNRFTCIGFSEIDTYANTIYQRHFPTHQNYGDITTIDEKNMPDFDLLVGGFPCQAFSIAGKRGGFNDTRGTMFFEIARIVREKQPRLLLLENVKGLLSHDQGNTFYTIVATLDALGYDLQWQVLNSKNHGVPQNRERIFIVGHLRGARRPEVFPFASDTEKAFQPSGQPANPLTLDTGMQLHMLTNNRKIRRLTPIECERLQGFPDGWTKGISDTQRYKCLGNAVTVNVIEAIVSRMISPY